MHVFFGGVVLASVLAVVFIFAVVLSDDNQKLNEIINENTVIAKLGDEPITYGEFQLIFPRYRASVAAQIYREYGLTDDADFWTMVLEDGTTALERAKEETMEQLKQIKAEQILWKEYGICSDISYPGFVRQWTQENEQRQANMDNGMPVYGPVQYNKSDYFAYLLDINRNRLEKLITEGEIDELASGNLDWQVAELVQSLEFEIAEKIYGRISAR